MEMLGSAVRSASRGLGRLVGRKEEEQPRSKSIIIAKKAGYGYEELTEVEAPTGTPSPKQLLTQSKYASKYSSSGQGNQRTEYGLVSDSSDKGRPRGSSQPLAMGWNMLGSAPSVHAQKNSQQAQINEENDEEFEVINNLTNISKAVKTPEDAILTLQKAVVKRSTATLKQAKISGSPLTIKVAFFYLVGSNCMPDELRIPWYLKVMSSTMVLSKGTEVLAKMKSPASKGLANPSASLITPLRLKDIKANWKKYLNCDIPDHVLFRIELTLKQNELCKQGPPSLPTSNALSTFVKFYSLWAMVLYKALQKSASAITVSRSMHSKSDLFVDYAGNKIPPEMTDISGIFEGVWAETVRILQADRFIESWSDSKSLHPGNACYYYIDKMIAKSQDKAQRLLIINPEFVRTEIYNAISTLQKNFFFWEESQATQLVNSGYMLDLFVLLQGKLVVYLVAKIIATTKLEELKEWATKKTFSIKLLQICKDLVTKTSYDQVTDLLDFEFIESQIYQTGAKN